MAAAAAPVVDAAELALEFGKLKLEGVDEAQQAKMDELGNLFPGADDATRWRMLSVNNWDLAAAKAQLGETMKWREANNVASFATSTHPKFETIRKCIAASMHGYDKEGYPLYFEKTGKIHAQALMDSCTPEEFAMNHVYGMEQIIRKGQEQSLKLGRRVDKFTTVLDLEGLGLSHRNAIGFLRACAYLDNAHYPRRMHRCLIVNSPWIMPMLYNLVKVFLNDDVKSRVQILAGDAKQALAEFVPPESLPVEYGGTCECHKDQPASTDGVSPCCIPVLDASGLLKGSEEAAMQKVNVPAGKDYRQELVVKGGEMVSWYFKSVGEYDVDFSVELYPEGGQKVVIKQPSRCTTSKGGYEAASDCKVVFVWDNSYSWFNSKDLVFDVLATPVDTDLQKLQQ